MSTQNEIEKRLKKARSNVGLFQGATIACCITTAFLWMTTGINSPGTLLATALTGLFAGLMIASSKRAQTLASRMGA